MHEVVMTKGSPINIDFIKMRDCQHAILREALWMLGELDGLETIDIDDSTHMSEARQLVGSLSTTGNEFIDSGFAELKQYAIDERSDQECSSVEIKYTINRLLNGLHALVAPIDGLIRRICIISQDSPVSTTQGRRLPMILMAGMSPILQAVDGIAGELRSLLEANLKGNPGQDFGVYDPDTD